MLEFARHPADLVFCRRWQLEPDEAPGQAGTQAWVFQASTLSSLTSRQLFAEPDVQASLGIQ